MAEESKNEYAAQLQNFNAEQWKHFNVAIPQIFKVMMSLIFSFCYFNCNVLELLKSKDIKIILTELK